MDIVSTRLMGGLGNMMYQIATSHSIALRDNKEIICDITEMQIPHKPYTYYTNNIFRNIKFSNSLTNLKNMGEGGFHYTPIPKINGNIKLVGHFQSEKYFIEHRDKILELFEIDNTTKTYLSEKYGDIINQDTCSIHIRRGDYLGLPNYHPTQSIEYYKEAIQIIGEEKHFLVFSDDIEWCKQRDIGDLYSTNTNQYQDLYEMTLCSGSIITNSSFSWWGAYLTPKQKIIAPKKWFSGGLANTNWQDIYCEDWIII